VYARPLLVLVLMLEVVALMLPLLTLTRLTPARE
jgi:hypothetical protein